MLDKRTKAQLLGTDTFVQYNAEVLLQLTAHATEPRHVYDSFRDLKTRSCVANESAGYLCSGLTFLALVVKVKSIEEASMNEQHRYSLKYILHRLGGLSATSRETDCKLRTAILPFCKD